LGKDIVIERIRGPFAPVMVIHLIVTVTDAVTDTTIIVSHSYEREQLEFHVLVKKLFSSQPDLDFGNRSDITAWRPKLEPASGRSRGCNA
jgi:hypothetical protein